MSHTWSQLPEEKEKEEEKDEEEEEEEKSKEKERSKIATDASNLDEHAGLRERELFRAI